MHSSTAMSLQKVSLLYNLAEKNARAHQIIKDYAQRHAIMDVVVGGVSWIPGLAYPAILASITLQSQVIYKPMAEDLAAVYLRDTDSYIDNLGRFATVATVGMEFAQEFGWDFLTEHAQELLLEVGFGGLATLIPGVGIGVAAGLDYLIAQMMTWRVGTMTAIYFQNGGEWVGNQKSTMEIAGKLTGGLHVTLTDLLPGKTRTKDVRVDLDEIPEKVPQVKRSAIQNILPIIKGFADKLPRPLVKESLIAMGLSAMIVDAALHAYYA